MGIWLPVSRRLPKKKPQWIILHLEALSIFKTRVLNLALPAFSERIVNLLKSSAMKNTGATIEITKNAYEKNNATFLMAVELLASMIFMIAKNVKSK